MKFTLWVYYQSNEENDRKAFQEISDAVGRVSPKTIFGPEENAFTWTYNHLPTLLGRTVTNLLALPYVTRVSVTPTTQ